MTLLQVMLLCLSPLFASAEKMEVHKKTLEGIVKQTEMYEKRLEELKVRKETAAVDDPDLDEVLLEIAEMQKELLTTRHKKTLLTEHLQKEHSREEWVMELKGLTANSKKNVKDDALDRRLDQLLKRMQAQYARTSQEKTVISKVQPAQATINQKREEIQEEEKDKYLREKIKSTLKAGEQ